MSKITQALEKAARERLARSQAQPSVPITPPVVVPVTTRARLGEIPMAEGVAIDPHIVSAAEGSSAIAEQYRILRTNLQSLRLRPTPKVIVVTSAVSGEGKSVTALNLALTLARQENLRVVLVDGDMRRSSIPRWLGLKRGGTGLSTVLSQGGELDGALVNLQSPRLAVLPAGPRPGHPAELLESVGMKRLLATLKTEFDLIIIDAPPVLPVADPGILAAQADGVLLVVRSGKTQRKTVAEAQELLTKMKARVLGCVLTHVEYYLPSYRRYYQQYYGAKQQEDGHEAPGAPSEEPASPALPEPELRN